MLEEENYLTRPKIRVDTLVPRQFITIPAYTKVSTIKIEVPIGNIILIEKVQKVKENGGTSWVASSSKLFHIKAVCDNICPKLITVSAYHHLYHHRHYLLLAEEKRMIFLSPTKTAFGIVVQSSSTRQIGSSFLFCCVCRVSNRETRWWGWLPSNFSNLNCSRTVESWFLTLLF